MECTAALPNRRRQFHFLSKDGAENSHRLDVVLQEEVRYQAEIKVVIVN
jgi:hypothetical protein